MEKSSSRNMKRLGSRRRHVLVAALTSAFAASSAFAATCTRFFSRASSCFHAFDEAFALTARRFRTSRC